MGLVNNRPHRWHTAWRALEHAKFRRLWLATFLSNCGSWMQRVATSWLIYSESESVVWLGVDSIAGALPLILLLPFGGAIADRFDRKSVLLYANSAQSCLSLLLACLYWYGWLEVWILVFTSFVSAAITSLSSPANQAFVPQLAGEDHLPNAIALNSIQYNVARFVGPALAGILIASLGIGACYFVNAISFVGLIVVLRELRGLAEANETIKHRGESDLRVGFSYAYQSSTVFHSLVLIVAVAFASAPVVTLLPMISTNASGLGSTWYTVLLASLGLGGAMAGLVQAMFSHNKRWMRAWEHFGIPALAIFQASLPFSNDLIVSVILVWLCGVCMVGAMINLGTDLIAATPDDLRGRMSSLQQFGFRVAQPIGSCVAAFLVVWTGPSTAFAILGCLLIAVYAVLLRYKQSSVRS